MSNTRFRPWTTANILTVLRLLLLPFAVVAFLQDQLDWYVVGMGLVGIGELLDATDGHVARERGEVSDFGRLLDPMSDSLARFVVFLTFVSLGHGDIWMLFVFFARDVIVAYMRSFSSAHGFVMAARLAGKLKAGAQAAAQAIVLLAIVAVRSASEGWPTEAGAALFWTPIATVLAFCLVYFSVFRIRGWLLTVLIAATVILAALLVWFRFWPPVGAGLDERRVAWWAMLGATLVTAYSLVDYAWAFKKTMLDAPANGASRGS